MSSKGKAGVRLSTNAKNRRDADETIAIPQRPLLDCMRSVVAVAIK
jgi:hypothetical protein